jgi:hypothetical protein
VTNIGAVNEETYACRGVTVIVPVPAWPGVRVRALADVVDGVRLETVTTNEEAHCELMATDSGVEVEPVKVALPA